MKRVRFHDAARDELIHETLYYKNISAALGERFAVAVEQAATPRPAAHVERLASQAIFCVHSQPRETPCPSFE